MSLTDQLIGPAPQQEGQQPKSLADHLGPLAGDDPAAHFMLTLMDIADRKGILDDSFKQPSIDDRLDLQDPQADPMEFLSREELTELVQKYMAIEEPRRTQIGDELKRQLPPQVGQRLDAVVRMVMGKQ